MSDAMSYDYWSSAEEDVEDINDVDEILEEETSLLTKAETHKEGLREWLAL